MPSIRKLAVLVSIVCWSGLAFAQGGATGAITGTVQDASGAVLSGAKVSVVSEATGQVLRHLTTDTSGVFTDACCPSAPTRWTSVPRDLPQQSFRA